MNAPAGQIRKGRKYDQVLAGAREVFLADGYYGASVDDIARAAGVSKATLYKYFTDKQQLFIEVARLECTRMADETMQQLDMSRPLREVMTTAATGIVRFLLSDFAQSVFRVCVAEADRFPELGRHFYECGPKLGQDRIMAFCALAAERGQLRIDDPALAADQFAELCRATLWPRAMFGIQSEFSETEIRYVAEQAVETFLARFGA